MRTATILILTGLIALPAVASAEKGGHGAKTHGKAKADGKEKSKEESHGKAKSHGSTAAATVKVGFSVHQRDSARGWFGESYGRGKCPPGLEKKKNGCLPPGQAKKRYTVGLPLPPGLPRLPPPPALLKRIGPPPAGHEFIMLDGDLVQLAIGTALVVDAVQALVD